MASAAVNIRRGDAASGDVKAAREVLAIQVTDAPPNKSDLHGTPIIYYITVEADGHDALRSQDFQTSSDGKFEWDSVVIPAAGSWTVHLRDSADDGDVDTQAVTVS